MASRTTSVSVEQTTEQITTSIETYLADHPNSLLLENGHALFDLRTAKYSISTASGHATLHLWSEERNLVRRVIATTPRAHTLSLITQRFGQPRPQTLELTPDKSLRTPSTRDANRQRYLHLLERALLRTFPDEHTGAFRSAMDLERSFGPAYARGVMMRGQHAWAVIGINGAEPQSSIDGILTLGILWLQHCRDHASPTTAHPVRLFQGLRLILPRDTASTTLSRLGWLNERIARYQLFELNEVSEDLTERDPRDHGNLTTRLIHTPSPSTARSRFAEAIPRVLALLPPNTPSFGLEDETTALPATPPPAPEPKSAHRNTGDTQTRQACELRLRSNTELAFLLHGLEFARIRSSFNGNSFNRQLETTVGSGPSETPLTASNELHLRELVHHLFRRRTPLPAPNHAALADDFPAPAHDPLFRVSPERWLESAVRLSLPALDPRLQPAPVYTEVPAFTGAGSSLDRGMLDLLALTRDNRLAVIELKADEDLHLALQGLDYWIRIRHHHLANIDPTAGLGDLQQHGYFPQTRLSAESPHLFLAAPALHIHPATETILRHLDRRVTWTLIALDERWRTRIKAIWRKTSSD